MSHCIELKGVIDSIDFLFHTHKMILLQSTLDKQYPEMAKHGLSSMAETKLDLLKFGQLMQPTDYDVVYIYIYK